MRRGAYHLGGMFNVGSRSNMVSWPLWAFAEETVQDAVSCVINYAAGASPKHTCN